ncbi:hypothetical protein [Candidatus Desulforudis audaxviator]|uniref:Uncharacterized protein n=1 Tax=Desulforudis audaxviator (strain MP104C) TaxID=477974 RepID=B1I378_DESAP|nr:hypothetical protein [Candidatus Desulforudis audaxviator]ACA59454.1 hypothetical protein Daud_0941 [Candidatus Desulforudis audaxviator MP104C]AZK59436.1 hypothetical protein Daudx_0884 [Candidatus Desulforudis audaxviator]
MKEDVPRDVRVYRVRFKYPDPSRYYYLSDSSGYPSADYRMPNISRERERIVVREVQE